MCEANPSSCKGNCCVVLQVWSLHNWTEWISVDVYPMCSSWAERQITFLFPSRVSVGFSGCVSAFMNVWGNCNFDRPCFFFFFFFFFFFSVPLLCHSVRYWDRCASMPTKKQSFGETTEIKQELKYSEQLWSTKDQSLIYKQTVFKSEWRESKKRQ